MTAFVKETEPLLERGQGQVIRPDERAIQQLVRGFASDWKRSIEDINQEIMRSFSNFKWNCNSSGCSDSTDPVLSQISENPLTTSFQAPADPQ